MTSEKLTYSSRACLLNKKIIDIGENWIKLENGWIIYLDENEISFLNSSFEEPEENK